MALTPVSWMTMPNPMPMRVMRRIHGVPRCSLALDCASAVSLTISAISSTSGRGSPVRSSVRTSSASALRPLLTSQRGDSGTKWTPIHRAAAGMVASPSMRRQACPPSETRPIMALET